MPKNKSNRKISAGIIFVSPDDECVLCVLKTEVGDEYWHKCDRGKLAFPGGHINVGDTAWETAKREMFEETGILILEADGTEDKDALVIGRDCEIISVVNLTTRDNIMSLKANDLIFYIVKCKWEMTSPTPSPQDTDEIAAVGWVRRCYINGNTISRAMLKVYKKACKGSVYPYPITSCEDMEWRRS